MSTPIASHLISVDETPRGARAAVTEVNRYLRRLRDGAGAASAVLDANRNLRRFEAEHLAQAS